MKAIDKQIRHKRNDDRSLELHREVARLLKLKPALIRKARQNIKNWMKSYKESGALIPDVLKEWDTLLAENTVEYISRLIKSRSEKARSLRQSSPFAGIISTRVRNEIIESFAN